MPSVQHALETLNPEKYSNKEIPHKWNLNITVSLLDQDESASGLSMPTQTPEVSNVQQCRSQAQKIKIVRIEILLYLSDLQIKATLRMSLTSQQSPWNTQRSASEVLDLVFLCSSCKLKTSDPGGSAQSILSFKVSIDSPCPDLPSCQVRLPRQCF